jgi:hypothetical protein
MFISTALIPGVMFGVEFPNTDEGDFVVIVDFFVFRLIIEKFNLD